MKHLPKIYREDSYDQSDIYDNNFDERLTPEKKKVIQVRESPPQDEVKIVYVRNSQPEISLLPNSNEKYLYKPNFKQVIVPSSTIVAKNPSVVRLAPIHKSITTLPFNSAVKYKTFKRNSLF